MKTLVVAPFSNSAIRDWPISHYRHLMEMITKKVACRLSIIGAQEHMQKLLELQGQLKGEAGTEVVIKSGERLSAIANEIRSAELVLSNNSGIAHLAAALNRPVIVIFSASHEIDLWAPRGQDVTVIQADISCQRCHLDHNSNCPNGHRCMLDLSPERVLSVVIERLR